jgi:hypothetical protein
MRVSALPVLLVSPLLFAQAPPAESPTLVALRDEVHQLRLAIECSTLLGTRTQIAIERIRTQEARVAQSTQRLSEVQQELARSQAARNQFALEIKDSESHLSQADPTEKQRLEGHIQDLKRRVEDVSGESEIRAREAEASSRLQTEQGLLNQLQIEMNQLAGALDQAIQQMTGQRP